MGNEVEEIKSRLNIVDVLGEYIRLEKAGANWKAICPFHNEKSPSFMVNEEKQFWHCFGCQKHGDIFTFVQEMEGLDFRETLKQLAEKAGVKLANYNPKKTEEKNRTIEILELATKWYEYQLWSGPGKIKILNYLRERGIEDETIKEFRLGYAPKGWNNIMSFLLSRGFKVEEIAKTGLLVEKRDTQISNDKFPLDNKIPNSESKIKNSGRYYDRFRERIMFPIADYSGKVLGYSARVTPGSDESQAKYVNTPETEVYHKGRVLYGLDKARASIKQEGFTLFVEGNMDVIAASQAGLKNTVAVSGTALTPEQVHLAKRYAPKMKMLFDMDAAGQMAAQKSLKIASAEDIETEIVSLPFGKDAADVARERPEELKKAVAASQNAVEYFLERNLARYDKDKAEDKRKLSEVMMEIVSDIKNSVEKNYWIKKIAEKIAVSETALTDMLKRATLKSRIERVGTDKNKIEPEIWKTKLEMLTDELIALILSSCEVWKEAEVSLSGETFAAKDSLLKLLLEKGESVGFDFDRLTTELVADPEMKNRAEKIYFRKKYRLGINNELEEVVIDNPRADFQTNLREIESELKRQTLIRLTSDLKMAEERQDKEALVLLRHEFNKISQSLAQSDNK
ncbi:MAG: DNA primase [Candidatus Pacebacteria bacterium]|nr:DNA primase [Candidatus Paceibacterota bacterium]MDR3583219.1 DNA primase [Candidatus Paceibacterota bacterium]